MSALHGLDDAHILLLAVHFTSEGRVDDLRRLVSLSSPVLSREITYRILLTFCPQDVDTGQLLRFLQYVEGLESPSNTDPSSIDVAPMSELSQAQARKQGERLHLRELPESRYVPDDDLLSRFLLARAYHADVSGDDLLALVNILAQFTAHSQPLREWFVTTLLPLVRLRYEYYPEKQLELSVRDVETLRGRAGVSQLLTPVLKSNRISSIGRDLRCVVAPWVYGNTKRKKRTVDAGKAIPEDGADWHDINEWLLATGSADFDVAHKAILEWAGPGDVDLGGFMGIQNDETGPDAIVQYCQAALATLYVADESIGRMVGQARAILGRVAELLDISLGQPTRDVPDLDDSLAQTSRASLFRNNLLIPGNPLTTPSSSSLHFLQAVIESVNLLSSPRNKSSIAEAVNLCLFASEDQQLQELKRLLQRVEEKADSKTDWASVREEMLWLQSWMNDPTAVRVHKSGQRALFHCLSPGTVDRELMRAILSAGAFTTALNMFGRAHTFLDTEAVESIVVDAIYQAYDNASNGNRSRGGILRAYQILKTFQPQFPQSKSLRQIEHLIAATHSLSFYHITLQQGVPFQPVSIRIHKEPLLLVEKVLQQNPRAYTKLDDLIDIGRNLVEAGIPAAAQSHSDDDPSAHRSREAQQRVTYLAINSALSSHDFGTAYSYITTRLSMSQTSSSEEVGDDSSWRAAYAAGRYEPYSRDTQSLQDQITHLSRRMELLSLALMLAPTAEYLPDVLDTWRNCEDRMDFLKAQDATRAREFEAQASDRVNLGGMSVVPGGFGSEAEDREADIVESARLAESRRGGGAGKANYPFQGSMRPAPSQEYGEEGPLGLFDVARGAASALQRGARSAYDAGSERGLHIPGRMAKMISPDAEAVTTRSFDPTEGQFGNDGRIRKRDMIGNMVTGGLVSGMSWVLGAPPTRIQDKSTAPWGEEE